MHSGSYVLTNSASQRALKRAFDVALALLVVGLVLWWLVPLLAILIKLESRGPVFFAQKRTGKNNQTFVCYKFRTMRVNLEAHRKQAAQNDARITRLGHILRETNLDELPQFWNVLRGDMSVVGPRPHMLRHTVDYMAEMPNYAMRHRVRPGITGLAQVRGYIGAIDTRTDLQNRIESDLEYIADWSFGMDVAIFVQTVLGRFRNLPERLRQRMETEDKQESKPALTETTANRPAKTGLGA